MATEPTPIDIAEFRAVGYLQEVNRRFLHPLGLALAVRQDEDGSEHLSAIYDHRADPEGAYYGGDKPDAAKTAEIDRLWAEREPARREALGFMVQGEG